MRELFFYSACVQYFVIKTSNKVFIEQISIFDILCVLILTQRREDANYKCKYVIINSNKFDAKRKLVSFLGNFASLRENHYFIPNYCVL